MFWWAYSEGELVASVLQLVITGIEGKGLHDVGSGPQELPVQLTHCKTTEDTIKTFTDGKLFKRR